MRVRLGNSARHAPHEGREGSGYEALRAGRQPWRSYRFRNDKRRCKDIYTMNALFEAATLGFSLAAIIVSVVSTRRQAADDQRTNLLAFLSE